MLGNQADAFFTTPMRTSVVSGNARNAQAGMMPAPYTGSSSTRTVTVKAGNMMPGVGGPMMPSLADDPAAEIVADTKKFLGMTLPVLAVVSSLAFLFLTAPGAQIRAKIGF